MPLVSCWFICICIRHSVMVSCKRKHFFKTLWKILTQCFNVWQNILELACLQRWVEMALCAVILHSPECSGAVSECSPECLYSVLTWAQNSALHIDILLYTRVVTPWYLVQDSAVRGEFQNASPKMSSVPLECKPEHSTRDSCKSGVLSIACTGALLYLTRDRCHRNNWQGNN